MTHMERVAIRKAGVEGWVPYLFEWVGDVLIVGGSVPTGVYKSGKRKGRPKWDRGAEMKVSITTVELDAEYKRYESDEDKCHECYGKGEVVSSVSVREGTKYRPCARCHGTGKPITPLAEATP